MIIARVLVVLAALIAALSLLAGFIRYQALDNETFNDTAAELIANKTIRDQVALTLVEALYENVDVQAALEERLPTDQQGLAGPISAVARELADRAAIRVLERPRAQELWVRSLSTTHEQLLRVLDDELTNVSTEDGVVVLNLQPLVVQLGERVAIFGRVAEQPPTRHGADPDHGGRPARGRAGRDRLATDPRPLPLARAHRARRDRDLARGRQEAIDRPDDRHRRDRRRHARARRP